MHKSYLWLLIDLCLLWSIIAIHTEYSQNIAWINWVVNASVRFRLENVCAILWPGAAALLPLTRDSSAPPSYKILASKRLVEGASLHGEHTPSTLVGVAVQSHPWLSLGIVCSCLVLLSYLIMQEGIFNPALLMNGLKVASLLSPPFLYTINS